nr:MAG TPA: Structural protein [Caudoviricetes sp.]
MYIEKIASQIKNDILSGLRGYHHNLSLNLQQLEDEVVQTRLLIIRQQIASGMFPIKDLLIAINCVEVDCESLERCKCKSDGCDTPVAHFQIPQIMSEFGNESIDYIGSIDRKQRFTIIKSLAELQMRQYRKRGKNKPYVWIDFAPNSEGMLDCFLFNCPFIKQVSVVGVFKDPRQIEKFNCCTSSEYSITGPDDNQSYISQLIKDKITQDKVRYYRQLAAPIKPNDQEYSTGN